MTATPPDLIRLRLRAAEWLHAAALGDRVQRVVLTALMDREGLKRDDIVDELNLLRAEFDNRPLSALYAEVLRLRAKVGTSHVPGAGNMVEGDTS